MTTGLSQLLASGRLACPCPFFICKMKVVVAATQEGHRYPRTVGRVCGTASIGSNCWLQKPHLSKCEMALLCSCLLLTVMVRIGACECGREFFTEGNNV